MKILRVLTVAVSCLAIGPALAGVTPQSALPAEESKSVQAIRALLTRCLPPILEGSPAVNTGLLRAEKAVANRLLGERPGDVWTDRNYTLMVVDFEDTALCRVIALGIEPAVLGDLVLGVFREKDTPFSQQRFRIDEDGGFAAVYTAGEGDAQIIVRISTASTSVGDRFATLSVERSVTVSH